MLASPMVAAIDPSWEANRPLTADSQEIFRRPAVLGEEGKARKTAGTTPPDGAASWLSSSATMVVRRISGIWSIMARALRTIPRTKMRKAPAGKELSRD